MADNARCRGKSHVTICAEEDDEEISRQLEQELLNLSLTQQKIDDEKKQEESRKRSMESRTQAQRRESERKEKQTQLELDQLSEHDKKRRKELELQQKLEEQNRLQQEKEERMRIHRLQQEAKESEREIQREQQWLSQEAEKDLRKPNLIPSPPKTYMSPSAAQGEAEKDLRKPNLIPSPPKTYMSPSAAQGVRRTPSRIGQDKLSPEKFDPASLFTKPQIAGREIRMIKIKKEKDTDLGVTVEGGIDSVLGGKVIVTEVWEGGLAHTHGGLYKGDQIMNCNGRTMLDIRLARAQEILREEMKATGDSLTLVIAVAPPKAYEDEVKKLTHTLAMGDIPEGKNTPLSLTLHPANTTVTVLFACY
ncbi:Harmonin [Branchiostoma belcheri]|nr:Harmonin [Branchiostoma belcheri]